MNRAALLKVHATERTMPVDDNVASTTQPSSSISFRELHALYSRRLYKTIAAITKNPQDAEDALQDTFLRAYLGLGTFEGRSSIYSWLTRIAVNSSLMILRKQRARAEVLFDPQPDPQFESISFQVTDSAPNPEELYRLRQCQVRLLRAIRNLDTHLRDPIRMRIRHGASMKEISRALNLSEATVKTRLHRARLRLSTAHDLNRPARTSNGIAEQERGKQRSKSQ
jgi:RNA polymerase sigma-70 factor, ECF subfamily